MNDVSVIGGIARATTVDQVAAALRSAILDGRLPPGQALRESDLTAQFNVSRGPVREALRELASEGLVDHQPHKGATVASLDAADVADVYRARLVLEMTAAEQLAGHPGLLAGVEAALASMGHAARTGDIVGFVDAHARFHRALITPLGSARLRRFFDGLERELRLSFAVLERLTGSLSASLSAHEELFAVLSAGDPDAARRAIADHLHHGADDVAELPRLVGDG